MIPLSLQGEELPTGACTQGGCRRERARRGNAVCRWGRGYRDASGSQGEAKAASKAAGAGERPGGSPLQPWAAAPPPPQTWTSGLQAVRR